MLIALILYTFVETQEKIYNRIIYVIYVRLVKFVFIHDYSIPYQKINILYLRFQFETRYARIY